MFLKAILLYALLHVCSSLMGQMFPQDYMFMCVPVVLCEKENLGERYKIIMHSTVSRLLSARSVPCR